MQLLTIPTFELFISVLLTDYSPVFVGWSTQIKFNFIPKIGFKLQASSSIRKSTVTVDRKCPVATWNRNIKWNSRLYLSHLTARKIFCAIFYTSTCHAWTLTWIWHFFGLAVVNFCFKNRYSHWLEAEIR